VTREGIKHHEYIGNPNRAERRRHYRENHEMKSKTYPNMQKQVWVCQRDNCNIQYMKAI
jgi:hypothetical protein